VQLVVSVWHENPRQLLLTGRSAAGTEHEGTDLMSTLTIEQAEQVAIGWRTGSQSSEEWTSPAGPLFVSGEFAEADASGWSTKCGTNCTVWSCIGDSDVVAICC
jgi:hypothetical protein